MSSKPPDRSEDPPTYDTSTKPADDSLSDIQQQRRKNQEDSDAAIVRIIYVDRGKPKGEKGILCHHEVVLLPPDTTRQAFLDRMHVRLPVKRDGRSIERQHVLYEPCNASEFVRIDSEDDWDACRVLLRRHEDSRLGLYRVLEPSTEVPGSSASKKGKKCIVQ